MRDGYGRITTAWSNNGTNRKLSIYNAKSQVTTESNYTGTVLSDTTTLAYTTASGASYLGQVTSAAITVSPPSGPAQLSRRDYNYAFYDGAVLTRTDFDIDTSSTTLPVTYSTNAVGGHGELLSATITDVNPRTVTYVQNSDAQVIRRRETAGTGTTSSATELSNNRWYRFAGVELYESGSVTTGADGTANSSYTVREGDTLGSIALALWGDAMLWYRLAEANPGTAGIAGPASALTPGRTLSVPGGVSTSRHSADTFKPYDAVETAGNTQPGAPAMPAPAPPRKKGCGVVGQILSIIVAIAVFAIVATTPFAVFAPALSDAARQGVLIATGDQEKFSWKSVVTADLTASAAGPVGNAFSAIASPVIRAVVTQVAINALVQGVSVATGLQKRFDWTGIAVAGVVAGVSTAVSINLPGSSGSTVDGRWTPTPGVAPTVGNQLVSGMAGSVAGAATRSLIEGTSFGDNLAATLPSVIGTTIGNLVASNITGSGKPKTPKVTSGKIKLDDPPLAFETAAELSPRTDIGAGLAALSKNNMTQIDALLDLGPQAGDIVVTGRCSSNSAQAAKNASQANGLADPTANGFFSKAGTKGPTLLSYVHTGLGIGDFDRGFDYAIKQYGAQSIGGRMFDEAQGNFDVLYENASRLLDISEANPAYEDTLGAVGGEILGRLNDAGYAITVVGDRTSLGPDLAAIRYQLDREIAGFTPLGVGYAWYDTLTKGRDAPTMSKIEVAASLIGPAGKLVGAGIKIFGKVTAKSAPVIVNAAERTAVIGRMDDLTAPGALRPGEYTIADKLPNLGTSKANYYQNMSVLRDEMRRGAPIRDASAFKPDSFPVPTALNPGRTVRQTFTGAERNLLTNRGWTFDGQYWSPPK